MDVITILIRFGITFFLSLLFGMERQYSHKPIGFGTFLFVSTGSCALALITMVIPVDNPIALLASIVTGIGFLGAGALIKTSDKIFGFTSAASIWAFAIFGLIIGIGQYWIGLTLYVLIWIAILIEHLLKKKGIGAYRIKINLTTNKIISVKHISSLLTAKHKMIDITINKKDKKMIITFLTEGAKEEINKLPEKLMNEEWFESMKIE